jgi:putative pantetheine hydrolase
MDGGKKPPAFFDLIGRPVVATHEFGEFDVVLPGLRPRQPGFAVHLRPISRYYQVRHGLSGLLTFDFRASIRQMRHRGPNNALTDVPGIRVGHATRIGDGALTGATVVLLPPDCVTAVDVRGGGPCTRETASLDPRHGGGPADAIVLSGGSVYGLSTADGVLRWLADHLVADRAPVVPAACLFDLGRGGDFGARPTAESGVEAVANAAAGPVEQGNVGAGTGAVTAGIKGGIGTASVLFEDGTVVAALAAVNAAGSPVDPETGGLYGLPAGLEGEFPRLSAGKAKRDAAPQTRWPCNTVIGVIATNARLDLPQTWRLAGAGQDGLARAVRPAHQLVDGDTVFAVATGEQSEFPPIERVREAATSVFTRAMVHGVLAAESVTTPWGHIPAYAERFLATIV